MIKSIVTDIEQLKIKCKPCFFTPMDEIHNQTIIQDLVDTAEANRSQCIGLAANQIGSNRRIILVLLDEIWIVMVNPSFTPIRSAGIKKYKEGCLSFPERMFTNRVIKRRFKKIKLIYQLVTGKKEAMILTKLDAVCVQHEIDHLNGITI